jgi:hypothetical protein
MARKPAARRSIKVNRAPVLTLWAAVVAERLGFRRDEALTLGRAVAGLNAYSKGVSLGLFKPTPKEVRERRRKLRARATITVELLHRAVPAVHTEDGLRAVTKGAPINSDSVERYLEGKFADALGDVRSAMTAVARSYTPAELSASAYTLYTKFRPEIPEGKRGWGAAGTLSLAKIRGLASS